MMGPDGMTGVLGMWPMGLFWILVLTALVLAIAALIKFLGK
jgi:uncharacterized membrane protein